MLRSAWRTVVFLAGMTCLCLVALQPFTLNQMPHSADGLLQFHRTLALEHSLNADHPLWPRFSSGSSMGMARPFSISSRPSLTIRRRWRIVWG